MLKKKNIAMLTAATAVATSVMPAFAAVQTNQVDEATMIAEVEKMLETKYSNPDITGEDGETIEGGAGYKNSVYDIQATINGTTTTVKTVDALSKLIEESKVSGKQLTLNVYDKGHAEVNGEIVSRIKTKNTYYTSTTNAATHVSNNVTTLSNIRATTSAIVGDVNGAVITLLNGTEIELTNGDLKLDFTKPVDENGNLITVPAAGLDIATARKVAGFKNDEVAAPRYIDIATKKVAVLEFNGISTNKVEVKASDLYSTAEGYTKEGVQFVKDMQNILTTEGDFVVNGVRYSTTGATTTAVAISEDGGYEFNVKFTAWKKGETQPAATNTTVTVVGESQNVLVKILDAITSSATVSTGYTKLAGDDRFETAVEISKQAFDNHTTATTVKGKAKSVVLVGENAIVDGLAAAPLAAQKEGSILLTKKDEVPANVMAEIKRLVAKNADIYLIGGENTISKEVEAQLVKEMNANIIRLAGDDRFDTSLKIAEELTLQAGSTAFVVGGTGLADAMSVASFAANSTTQSPIIVTPQDGLTKDAKMYLKDTTSISTVRAIGGEAHISTQVLKDVKESRKTGAPAVDRISGKDRNDTNAKVIETLAATDHTLANIYVAKDGDTQLVDALAAAPLAGKTTGAIVLATNDLTDSQMATVTTKATAGANLTQVGNGISSSVIETALSLIGKVFRSR